MTKKKAKSDVATTSSEEIEQWETIDEAIEYFKQGFLMTMTNLTRLMWEVGRTGDLIMEKKAYGESNIEEFAVGIKRTSSWIYECVKMYKHYKWEDIQSKFLEAGIPASSIARLSCIEDDSTRNYVEDKLVSNEINYEEISKTKKEFEDRVNDTEHTHGELGEGSEPSLEETMATKNLGDDDPNSQASSSIRSGHGKFQRMLEELQLYMTQDATNPLNGIDRLSDISDNSLYDISQDRILHTGTILIKTMITSANLLGSIRKLDPTAIEGLDGLFQAVNEIAPELKGK